MRATLMGTTGPACIGAHRLIKTDLPSYTIPATVLISRQERSIPSKMLDQHIL
jgi:hypothetical protein